MAKPLDKMTKPELVKALKAAQKRIAKLEGFAAQAATSEGVKPALTELPVTYDKPLKAEDFVAERLPWETK